MGLHGRALGSGMSRPTSIEMAETSSIHSNRTVNPCYSNRTVGARSAILIYCTGITAVEFGLLEVRNVLGPVGENTWREYVPRPGGHLSVLEVQCCRGVMDCYPAVSGCPLGLLWDRPHDQLR